MWGDILRLYNYPIHDQIFDLLIYTNKNSWVTISFNVMIYAIIISMLKLCHTWPWKPLVEVYRFYSLCCVCALLLAKPDFVTKQNSRAHPVLCLFTPGDRLFLKESWFSLENGRLKPDHDTSCIEILLPRP